MDARLRALDVGDIVAAGVAVVRARVAALAGVVQRGEVTIEVGVVVGAG